MSEERKFTFSTQNSVDVLQDDPDMLIVSLDLMHEGENRNKCDIPHEAIVDYQLYHSIRKRNNIIFRCKTRDTSQYSGQ